MNAEKVTSGLHLTPGELIRRWREDKGMARAVFASKCGYAEEYVRQVENGYHAPSRFFVQKVAQVLGRPLGLLTVLLLVPKVPEEFRDAYLEAARRQWPDELGGRTAS